MHCQEARQHALQCCVAICNHVHDCHRRKGVPTSCTFLNRVQENLETMNADSPPDQLPGHNCHEELYKTTVNGRLLGRESPEEALKCSYSHGVHGSKAYKLTHSTNTRPRKEQGGFKTPQATLRLQSSEPPQRKFEQVL